MREAMNAEQAKLWMLRILRFIVGGIFVYASLDKIAIRTNLPRQYTITRYSPAS